MLFQRDLNCNVKQNTYEQFLCPKLPKKHKHKFIKQLNLKSKAQIKQPQFSSNQIIGSKRVEISRPSQSKQNTMQSLLQCSIIGAHILKGQWKDNKMNGSFVIEYENGCKFQGLFKNNVKVQGKMYYKFPKCTYQGSYFGQKFSGFGKLSYEGGRSIQGEWDNMQLIGNATITYPNQDVYYGPVDYNLYKHGQGYLFFNNGCKYIGGFTHGSITGYGSYYKNQQVIKAGLWKRGQLIRELQNEQRLMMDTEYYMSNFSKSISELSSQDPQLKQKLKQSNQDKSNGFSNQQVQKTQQRLIH